MSGFKYSSLDYDAYYDNEHCRQENNAVHAVLNKYCVDGSSVLDLGAGTGLVYSMIGNRCFVTQLEADRGMCDKNPYPNIMCCKAEWYLDRLIERNGKYSFITCLYALNYMRIGTLLKVFRCFEQSAVLLVYKNPWAAGSSSLYAGRKWLFKYRCGLRQVALNFLLWVHRDRVIERYDLLDEPYYEVVVLR